MEQLSPQLKIRMGFESTPFRRELQPTERIIIL